jgi:hypothetical protein
MTATHNGQFCAAPWHDVQRGRAIPNDAETHVAVHQVGTPDVRLPSSVLSVTPGKGRPAASNTPI